MQKCHVLLELIADIIELYLFKVNQAHLLHNVI